MEALRLEDRYNYTDYCSWPNDERWELIDGAAYAMAGASEVHQSVQFEFARQLGNFLRGKPCKAYVAPFDVRLNADGADDTVVQPDILVVCDESKLKDGRSVVGAPDLAVEILSPSTAAYDLVTKFRIYRLYGVREYWTVDPDRKTVAVHVLQDGKYSSRFYNELDTAVPIEVLDGCTINLAEVLSGA